MRWLAVALLLLTSAAFAGGDHPEASEEVRAWFRSVMSPAGVPCCSIADGHKTIWDMRQGRYWVPVPLDAADGGGVEWIPVPGDTVVRNAGNPFDSAVVWYYKRDGAIVIRCFVPASEA